MRRNQEVLMNKSLMNNLNHVSKCEEKMIDKLNSSRFILRERTTVSLKNGVNFTKDADVVNESHYEINDELKLEMQKEVNSQGSGRKALMNNTICGYLICFNPPLTKKKVIKAPKIKKLKYV